MSKIVGIGAAVMDTLVALSDFPKEDTKMRSDGLKQCGGGPTATGIVAAAKLGVDSGFIGVLSDDSGGQFLMSDFAKYSVDTSNIDVMSGYRSFTSQIWLNAKNKSRTIVFDKGDLPPLKLSQKQLDAVKNAQLLMVDGNELEAAIQAAKVAHQNGTKVLYDAGGMYDGVERLLPLCDILIPAEEFALGITGESNAEIAAKKLYDTYKPEVVVVTCGKLGGVMYDGERMIKYPIYPAEVVDSNGAGDVFHGAYAAAVIKGFDYEQCCHFSSAVSAIKCMGVGARESVPNYDTVIKYLKENKYEI